MAVFLPERDYELGMHFGWRTQAGEGESLADLVTVAVHLLVRVRPAAEHRPGQRRGQLDSLCGALYQAATMVVERMLLGPAGGG